ncbi:MAG: hypothetical protein VYC34_10070 [Planctomycetota bacterium]|nr:hypothetical protein [Planctomycetota bacterium]
MNHRCRRASLSLAALFTGASALAAPPAWNESEAPSLRNHVQLTFDEQFIRAGEAYFSPDANWIVFQAVPVPPEGEPIDAHYSMYVAKLQRDDAGRVTGAHEPIRVSPAGSANTCGWFHPSEPWRLIFGSTITDIRDESRSGYQRGQSRYQWQFPSEMDVCVRTVVEIFNDMHEHGAKVPDWPLAIDDSARAPVPLFKRPGYDAECAYSPNGRFIVYTAVNEENGDADIHILDTTTGKSRPIIVAPGYDGGPFFSPDGRRLCYRSDRAGNDLLQIYVADLRFDESGVPVGVEKEIRCTDNEHVNWAPFWHPSGDFLLYTTSEVGHHNYEIFALEAPSRGADVAPGDLRAHRITHAAGFDGMPAFSNDGSLLMWTSQRGGGPDGSGSSQVWIAEVVNASPLPAE